MRKTVKVAIFITAIILIVFALVSCAPKSGGDTGSKKFTVTLDMAGGSGVTAENFIKDGKFVKPLVDPVKKGHTFAGWYFDKNFVEVANYGFEIDKNITVFARWVEGPFYATFFSGSQEKEVVKTIQEGKVSPIEAKRDGYEFLGWYTDSQFKEKADFDEIYLKDTVFYAKWKVIEYKIAYDTSDLASTGVNAKFVYTVNDKISLASPVAVKKGYTFLHWLDENGKIVHGISEGSVGDRKFTAAFVCGNNFIETAVAGNVNGSKVTISVPFSTVIVDFDNMLCLSDRAEYTVSDGETVGTEMPVTVGENDFIVTVKAENGDENIYYLTVVRYEEGSVTANIHYPDGTESAVTVALGGLLEKQNGIEINGYLLEGFYSDSAYENKFDFNTALTEDADIYAKYVAANNPVRYVLGVGKGKGDNPDSFATNEGLVLKAPEDAENYTFTGWFADENYTEKITGFPAGSYGEKVAYAQFELKNRDIAMERDAFVDGQNVNKEDIGDLINWLVFNRVNEFSFYLLGDFESENAKKDFIYAQRFPTPCETYKWKITLFNDKIDVLSLTLTYYAPDRKTDGEDRHIQAAAPAHAVYTKVRTDDFNNFKINSVKNTAEVSDSEQLYQAVAAGYRPVPLSGSVAEKIYGKAKDVLRNIADDGMSDTDKIHAIFDWLVNNVIYDQALLELEGQGASLVRYNGFYLEGVFNNGRAVCDGISKAFVLLARIEGVECIRVTGNSVNTVKLIKHAWNKVKIDGEWYVVDATSGSTVLHMRGEQGANVTSLEIMNHSFFMITDERMSLFYAEDGESPEAVGEYNWFKTQYFTYGGETYDYQIENVEELKAALLYFLSIDSEETRIIDFVISYTNDRETVEQTLRKVSVGDFNGNVNISLNNNVLIFVILE